MALLPPLSFHLREENKEEAKRSLPWVTVTSSATHCNEYTMSRSAHLPPRCPFQNRASRHVQDPVSPTVHRNDELCPLRHGSPSQGSILEEQPSWLDELLSDSDTNSKGIFHRRSASDSVTLLEGLATFPSITYHINEQSAVSDKTGNGLAAGCTFGPNSPRQRGNVTHSKDLMISALSEYVPQKTLQCLAGNLCISGTTQSDLKGDACSSNSELDTEAKAAKRHPGHCSRVRKLQYIAELERTVNVLQTLKAELAARVASLLQKRVILSMENNILKQQKACLKQDKMVMDGQYQALKKEVDRLTGYVNHMKSNACFRTESIEEVTSKASWQMLDMGKLSVGWKPS